MFLLEVVQDAAVKPLMAKYQAPQEDRRSKSRKYLLDTKKHHQEVVDLAQDPRVSPGRRGRA